MDFKIYLVWFIFAAIFIVGEIFTAGFFLACFGVAAIVAGVLALIGANAIWQWVGFVIISGILFAVSRKFAEKFSRKQPPGIGADRFIGKEGIVLEEIDNMENAGSVRIDKEIWRAESESGEIIKKGNRVVVIKLDGTHVVVKTKEEVK
jgi:membrane protein implicated in regulation of membrane protease activity